MSIESKAYTALVGDTALMALATGGVFPVQLPDDASLPAVVYQIVDAIPAASGSAMTLNTSRVQISCMAASIGTARAMRDAVMAVAHGEGWRFELGPELKNDEGTFYMVPVDVRYEGA